ncbi:MAG: hypothetical protein PVF27_00515 [Gemmatimonadales bacterium]|jgi:hypothetical protein
MHESWKGGPIALLVAGTVLAACLDALDPVERVDDHEEVVQSDSIPSDSTVTDSTATDTTTTDTTTVLADLTLLTPEDGARIVQNDSSTGCPAHQYRGYGFAIHFDWIDADSVPGLDGYHLFVQHRGSPYPMVNQLFVQSEFAAVYCNAFVIDRNANDWYWLVWAVDSVGMVKAVSDTNWFSFEPCILANGRRCSAPAGSGPAFGAGAWREERPTGVAFP